MPSKITILKQSQSLAGDMSSAVICFDYCRISMEILISATCSVVFYVADVPEQFLVMSLYLVDWF